MEYRIHLHDKSLASFGLARLSSISPSQKAFLKMLANAQAFRSLWAAFNILCIPLNFDFSDRNSLSNLNNDSLAKL